MLDHITLVPYVPIKFCRYMTPVRYVFIMLCRYSVTVCIFNIKKKNRIFAFALSHGMHILCDMIANICGLVDWLFMGDCAGRRSGKGLRWVWCGSERLRPLQATEARPRDGAPCGQLGPEPSLDAW